MEINLETSLEHQQKAVDAVISVFNNVSIIKSEDSNKNPSINFDDKETIQNNINDIQKNIRADYRNPCSKEINFDDSCLHIDVKMETGTGKTYVYTKTIYEMHKQFGFSRFIIIVPSLAIKAGTSQFIKDSYVQKHFADACGYNSNIQLEVLESPKSNSRGRSTMPNAVRNFVWSDISDRKIYVMLVNMQMLTNGKLLKAQYDQTLFDDICQPFEALRAIKPVIIIDEPHRFSKGQTSYKTIMNELKPQILIRYGATFPEIEEGKGKNKVKRKDFTNLVYDLNACDAFNKGLIKGVIKEHIDLPKGCNTIEITGIKDKKSVTFKYGNISKELTINENLSSVCNDLSNILNGSDVTVESIGSNFITLSNNPEKELYLHDKFYPDLYSTSYQEKMIELALKRHFETEIENFKNNIKTLALFFINDISSYRQIGDNETYIKYKFEQLLKNHIESLLKDNNLSDEYKNYLNATLADIPSCHAGYFAQDNASKKDSVIAKEIDDILHNKKTLLSLKDEKGNYNTRRFLFSKWTLKEGWDNPNVFTIAKLRSSGSEISKLQEVGRGLRLPVNNSGNRISNGDFKLNYIVDYSEHDFAEKLVKEINGEMPKLYKIADDILEQAAKNRNLDSNCLFAKLLCNGFIDRQGIINTEKSEQLYQEYPEFNMGINSGRIINNNRNNKKQTITIKDNQFNDLKKLWDIVNQKYYIFFEDKFDGKCEQYLIDILKDNVFSEEYVSTERYSIDADSADNGNMFITQQLSGTQLIVHKEIPYNQFLRRVNKGTSIPIKIIHSAVCEYAKSNTTPIFTENSVSLIISKFKEKKIENIDTLRYVKSSIHINKTALTDENGNKLNEIALGRIGVMLSENTDAPDTYLYDKVAYDSDLEKDNIVNKPDNVIVYGKIPRSSISIPTILGENYSPDFMYVAKFGENKEYNLVIESKNVEGKEHLRGIETAKIKCAEKFFETLSNEGINVEFKTQLSSVKMQGIIDELLKKNVSTINQI